MRKDSMQHDRKTKIYPVYQDKEVKMDETERAESKPKREIKMIGLLQDSIEIYK